MEVLRRLWREEDEFDFEGKFYSIKKGESFPKPVQKPFPPIMNAGGSDKGREFAAKYADMCFALIHYGWPHSLDSRHHADAAASRIATAI